MQLCPFRDKNQWVELLGKTLQSLRQNYTLQTGQSTIVCYFDRNARYMKLYRAPFVRVYHTRMARMDRTFPYLASRHSATMLRICLSIWSSTLLTVVLFFFFCYITKQSHRRCYPSQLLWMYLACVREEQPGKTGKCLMVEFSHFEMLYPISVHREYVVFVCLYVEG